MIRMIGEVEVNGRVYIDDAIMNLKPEVGVHGKGWKYIDEQEEGVVVLLQDGIPTHYVGETGLPDALKALAELKQFEDGTSPK